MDLHEAYHARAEEVHIYERTWWLGGGGFHAGFLERYPHRRLSLNARLAEDLPSFTIHAYLTSQEEWHVERRGMQQDVVRAWAERDSAATEAQSAGGSGEANVYFLIGLPGSGKTSCLRPLVETHMVPEPGILLVSDADEVRAQLPEYVSGLGSGVVQDETVDMTYGGRNVLEGRQGAALADGRPVIIDVIGDPAYLPTTVRRLTEQGRRCFVLLARCPTSVCEQRVMARAVEQGRFVPLELVRQKEGVPEQALRATLDEGHLAGWAVVDTTHSPLIIEGDGTFST